MRKLLLVAMIFSFLIPGITKAQEIKVQVTKQEMFKGYNPGLTVVIPGVERRPLKRKWKRRLKDFDNEDVDKSRKKVMGKHLIIPSISDIPINAYTTLKSVEEGVRMTVFFELSENNYLNESHPGLEDAKKLIRNFAIENATEALNEDLEAIKDELDDKQKEMDDLDDRQKELKATIKECEKKIKDAEKALKDIDKARKDLDKLIKESLEKVEKMEEKIENLE